MNAATRIHHAGVESGAVAIKEIERNTGAHEPTHLTVLSCKDGALSVASQHQIRASTWRLVFAIHTITTEAGKQARGGMLAIKEFARLCDLTLQRGKLHHDARVQLDADIAALESLEISTPPSADNKHKDATCKRRRMFASIKRIRAAITWQLSDEFIRYWEAGSIMTLPEWALQIDIQKHPQALALNRYVLEMLRQNGTRCIALAGLLTVFFAAGGTTLAQVASSDRHIERRIIKPFLANLSAALDGFEWALSNAGASPLTDEQQSNLHDFDVLRGLRVAVTLPADYPKHRRERAKPAAKGAVLPFEPRRKQAKK